MKRSTMKKFHKTLMIILNSLCEILVLQPGIKPAQPELEGGFLTTGPPGKSTFMTFISR